MIKTIFVDYAGVITPVMGNYMFAKKYAERFNMDEEALFWATYGSNKEESTTKLWDEVCAGKFPENEFWDIVSKKLGGIDREVLKGLIIETFPIDERVVQKLRELHDRGFKLVLLSNQSHDWLESVIKEHKLGEIFDSNMSSYIQGRIKPDPEMFLYALAQTENLAEEVLFIDDNEKENIPAAEKLGINTIHFQNYEQFEAELRVWTPSDIGREGQFLNS